MEQLLLPLPTPSPCWLVAHDRVRDFHYVVEAEPVGKVVEGQQTVSIRRHCCRVERVTVPVSKVYPTKEAAIARQRECEGVESWQDALRRQGTG
jgi:hypothetical protein